MLELQRKRLRYRANHRGFKEVDILLGGFANSMIDGLSKQELTAFENLLKARDHDIYDWITGKQEVPDEFDTPLFEKIKRFKPRF